MKVLIRQALIIDPSSPYHLQQADISIVDGIISKIGSGLPSNGFQTVDMAGASVSPGWVDIFSHMADPGSEYAETIETGTAAAAAGGYTDVMLMPNTKPTMDSKSTVEYVKGRSSSSPVNVHPVAAVSLQTEGKQLAEMYDTHASGSVAFSDGMNPVQSAGVMLKALQYLKAINKTLIQVPDDKSVQPHGLMHEGIMSTTLGLPGKPAIGEEILIMRDLELLKYTGSQLHITGISTKRSLELIKAARKSGLNVTCSVTPYHLYFTDADLKDYDTSLKVDPPLRSKDDRDALRKGVIDGSIDCIASHHLPHHTDNKVIEFEHARPGMIGLQTAYAVVKRSIPQLSDERIVELFCTNPRKIFQLQEFHVREGEKACLTLFSSKKNWKFDKLNNRSRSQNSPFIDHTFEAQALGIINKGNLFLN